MTTKVLCFFLNVLLLYRPTSQESCNDPLGLEDGTIPKASLSASSEYNNWHGKNNVRLNGRKGAKAWCPKENSVGEYIQVDLSAEHAITGVATQGRNNTWLQYVTTYYLAHGVDGKTFKNYTDIQGKTVIFVGNDEVFGVKLNSLKLPVKARYVRLYPLSWKRRLCTQLEVYGCQVRNCSINNGGCSENCTQVNDIEIHCSCHKIGYKFVDGICKDIDECKQNKPCSQNCKNTDGSFACSCESGFTLGTDGKTCEDINECLGNHTCHQECENIPGKFLCKCKNGYEFGPDNKTCIDVDECRRHTSGCEHNCNNLVGSFKCSCYPGYKLASNQKSCNDVDECNLGIDKCAQICINKEGSYTCQCRNGYVRSKDGYGCDDIDECSLGSSGCSHTCVNNQGSYICTCPKGYKLNLDQKTCEDVDECADGYGNCQHTCKNTAGSYKCSCNNGYRLKDDDHLCEDVDECVEYNPCDLTSTVCTNTVPYYRCDCKNGYQPRKGNSSSCERVKCSALPTSSKFTVSPPRCLKSDTNLFEQTCSFACIKGYEPVDQSNMVVTCLADRQWSSGPPQCQGVRCPKINNPANGQVSPPECINGIRYPYSCHIRCNSGFRNKGPSTVACQNDGSYSVSRLLDLGCQKDIIAPVISCPPGIVADLPNGRKSMIISDKWKNAYSNVGTIQSSHDENFEFPVGITNVKFTARTKEGLMDSCSIRVTILDKEPPRTVYCPATQYVRITSTNKVVVWPKAQFRDNVGVVSVTSNRDFGELSASTYPILYTAKDAAGNSATCQFKVIVTEKVCSEDDFTVGSSLKKSCSGIPGLGIYCSVTCETGKIFLKQPASWYICTADGIWNPKDKLPVPDCVGYTTFKDKCLDGTVELVQVSGQKVCANCPAGTYYQKGKCVECLVGFYQNKEKQLSCMKCPRNEGTEKTGAKQCKRLCHPGTYSATGLPSENQACILCAVGSYQPRYGMKSCIKCPKDTSTLLAGKMSKDDCGRVGEITIKPSNKVTRVEGNDVTFSCTSTALPWLTVQWKKTNPVPDGFGGKVTQMDILEDGKLVGKTFKISKATYHDRGVYMCETTNQFGVAQASLYLDMLKDLSK